MKNAALTLLFPALLLFGISCNSTKQATEQTATTTKSQPGERPERMSPEEMFTQMDTNKDGKLSTTEVKGPLKDQFSTVDTDGDGFISMEEIKNAPRPSRQGRPGGGGRPDGK